MKGFIDDKEQFELCRKQTGNQLADKAAMTHGQDMAHSLHSGPLKSYRWSRMQSCLQKSIRKVIRVYITV